MAIVIGFPVASGSTFPERARGLGEWLCVLPFPVDHPEPISIQALPDWGPRMCRVMSPPASFSRQLRLLGPGRPPPCPLHTPAC